MTFEEVIQPALDLVENGHPVDDQFHAFVSRELGDEPSTAAVFNPDGHIPQVGEIFFQRDLANTFRRMIDAERAASGNRETGIRAARDLIYKGEIAHEIADFHAQAGGLLTYEDLAVFSVRVEPPTHITYKDYDVYTCGPWCQGPTLNMALKILEGADLQGMGHESADYLHTVIEGAQAGVCGSGGVLRRPPILCRCRWQACLTSDMPLKDVVPLIHNALLPICRPPAIRGGFIRSPRGKNGHFPTLDPNRPQPERISHWESDTSYLCVVDEGGNTFSATPSDVVGWAPIVPGLGFPVSARVRRRGSIRRTPPVCSRGNVHVSPKSSVCSQRWKAVYAFRLPRRRCTSARDAAGVPQYHRVRDGAAGGDRSPSCHQSQFSEFVLAPWITARRGWWSKPGSPRRPPRGFEKSWASPPRPRRLECRGSVVYVRLPLTMRQGHAPAVPIHALHRTQLVGERTRRR